ncbi:MAG: hypothetical protein L3J59_09525 [Methylococcaceae bacterium]|nr:hypothetical protein [Methylococcaceae bacterium]
MVWPVVRQVQPMQNVFLSSIESIGDLKVKNYILNWDEGRCAISTDYGSENITCFHGFATRLIKFISKDSVSAIIEKFAHNVRHVVDYLPMAVNSRKVIS